MSRLVKGASTTKYEHLGPRLVSERDASGTILRRYVHGPGDDEPVLWYEGATLTTKRWLHADERGSVIALSDASGASIAANRYDEYGIPAATNLGRFQYTGQAWLPELGLYYYKARMYAPTLGRFMQTDPIGYEDGINWYAYVGEDPVNAVDTSGTQESEAIFIGMRWARVEENDGATVEEQAKTEGAQGMLVAAAGAIIWVAKDKAGPTLGWAGRARGLGGVSKAFRVASVEGGRHHGTLKRYLTMTRRQLQKAIRGHQKQIKEHQDKIKDPSKFMKRDDPNDPAALKRAINDWQKTIERHKELRNIARDIERAK